MRPADIAAQVVFGRDGEAWIPVLVTGIQVSTVHRMARRGYVARLLQHQTGTGSEFTAKYGVMRLVWFDEYELITQAITIEKTMKK